MLVVDDVKLDVRRYWELQPPRPIRYRHDQEYADHFKALFFEAVRARLRSVYPISVMLSGGLDSTSIACTAQELFSGGFAKDPGFASFSSTFDDLDCDERPYITDVHAKYDFKGYLLPAGDGSRLQSRPRGFQESPNVGLSDSSDALFALTEQAGVRAILTGDVADACVYGSRMVFDSLLRQGRLPTFWRHLQAARRTSRSSLHTIIALSCIAPLLPLPAQRAIMTSYVRRFSQQHGDAILPRWFQEPLRADLGQRNVRMFLEAEQQQHSSNPNQENTYRQLWPPEVARHPAPWPFEIWRRFADRRLHEFLLAIPPEQHFQPHPDTDEFYAGSKWLLRRAMRGVLPESVRTRRQVEDSFQLCPGARGRHAQWSHYELAFGQSVTAEVAARGYVDQKRFWARLQEQRAGQGGTQDLIYTTQMLGLESSLRTFKLPREERVRVPRARHDSSQPAPPTAAPQGQASVAGISASTASDVPRISLHPRQRRVEIDYGIDEHRCTLCRSLL